MNTVDALNVLGKALCGDSFEVKPGLTDAETILEIAKNYTGGSGSGGSGGSNEEFDFKAFCQEWGPKMAAGELSPEDQMAITQAMNEIPQNIYIHCSGNPGSGQSGHIVADEDYGDNFLPMLHSVMGTTGRSVTLVTDMSVEGMEIRIYAGPLFLDNNSTGSSPTYYNLIPNGGQWASQIFTQDGREFVPDTIKFIEWSTNEA